MNLGIWDLECEVFDGEKAAGPVPTLFSPNPGESLQALEDDPGKAHKDLQRMAKMFIMPEYVGAEEAMLLVRKHR